MIVKPKNLLSVNVNIILDQSKGDQNDWPTSIPVSIIYDVSPNPYGGSNITLTNGSIVWVDESTMHLKAAIDAANSIYKIDEDGNLNKI